MGKDTNFWKTAHKSNFRSAVIIHQDSLFEDDLKEFNLTQLITAFDLLSDKKKKNIIKKIIKDSDFSFDSLREMKGRDKELDPLILEKICSLAKKPDEIFTCYKDDNKKLLEKLSEVEASFTEWEDFFSVQVFTTSAAVSDLVIERMKSMNPTFEQWEHFYIERYGMNHKQVLLELLNKALNFEEKEKYYHHIDENNPLRALVLKDLKNLAKKVGELAIVYGELEHDSETAKELKQKIEETEGTFDEWFYMNQGPVSLSEVSINGMRKTAVEFNDWVLLWCREKDEQGKLKACANIIRTAKDYQEAELAWHKARGTNLETKAKKRLGEIVEAL